jgi:hypothetical protein
MMPGTRSKTSEKRPDKINNPKDETGARLLR